jgi:hypothetical protein
VLVDQLSFFVGEISDDLAENLSDVDDACVDTWVPDITTTLKPDGDTVVELGGEIPEFWIVTAN